MNERIDFYFPIDPKWTEKELIKNLYKKIMLQEPIYGYEQHLERLKKSPTIAYFIRRGGQNYGKYPLIYFLASLIGNTFDLIKSGKYKLESGEPRILGENEIVIFRYFNLEAWPPKTMETQFWYTFPTSSEYFNLYFEITN